MKVPKAVRQKLFESKEGQFSGAECHASALFTRMVSALQTAFVTEDIGFAPLFLLDNATLPVRVEANNLLFSTLELMIDPQLASGGLDACLVSSHSSFPADGKRVLLEFARRMIPSGDPFQGQSDMLGVRIAAGIDPHDAIGDFNAALKAARTRATLLDEDVKALFIKALDSTFYQPVVSRLLLHDQRAAHDLLNIQQWDITDDPTSDLADLRTMVLDLKRKLATFITASDGSAPSRTPRADKPDRRMKSRFAATPALATRVGIGRKISPRRNGISAYAFAEEAENSVLAARFQHAIDRDNAEELDALCVLAGGKPDIVADVSACSFCEEDGEALVYAIDEYTDLARHVDTGALNINTVPANVPVVSEPAKNSPAASVDSEEEWTAATALWLWEDRSWVGPLFPNFLVAPPSGRWCWTGCLGSPNHGETTASTVRRRAGRHGGWCDDIRYTTAETGSVDRQERQGFRRYRVVPLPPELQDPDPPIPDSPPYSPPSYTSGDEAEGSTDDFDIGRPCSISSTNDSPPASEADMFCTLTLLRAGQTVPSTSSG
ncbi:hypothetical protein CYMTET_20433 [Cymbomonas tetramitiformis]|uniref:Uncharacterized protein n=1 Tax=Cymbomonas tetramitiformis TaxID=36881 RepID=A0AAE0L4A4_9CHLO|nr:hypothetical protein CYMTET_20433 [Cymbomonas tetramitiformis]